MNLEDRQIPETLTTRVAQWVLKSRQVLAEPGVRTALFHPGETTTAPTEVVRYPEAVPVHQMATSTLQAVWLRGMALYCTPSHAHLFFADGTVFEIHATDQAIMASPCDQVVIPATVFA